MRWLVTGASGVLGNELLRQLDGEHVVAWTSAVDLADPNAVAAAFQGARPDIVLHAGAMARVDQCLRAPDRALQVNTRAPGVLADLAAAAGARFIHVSTDLVFDGERGNYVEFDSPNPLSVYGRTKADAEPLVLAQPRTAVARLSLLFGRGRENHPTFFDQMLSAIRGGPITTVFTDEWRTPLAVPVAAGSLIALAKSDFTGLLHIGGRERLSRAEMGRTLADTLSGSLAAFRFVTRADVPTAEPRPRDTSLNSSQWRSLFPHLPWPSFHDAISSQSWM